MVHLSGLVTRTDVGEIYLDWQRRRRDSVSAVSPCGRGDGEPNETGRTLSPTLCIRTRLRADASRMYRSVPGTRLHSALLPPRLL
jgi:hypothetical protein